MRATPRRKKQLAAAVAKLAESNQAFRNSAKTASATEEFRNHLEGFYDEVDKLAKGKALMEVTHLVLAEANAIIKDAKELVKDDQYLARVNTFVPAGTNPLYPDVLVTMRTIQQSLDRFKKRVQQGERELPVSKWRMETVIAALQMASNLDEDAVTEEALRESLGDRPPDRTYLTKYSDSFTTKYFDFGKLDLLGLDQDQIESAVEDDDSEGEDQD